jgi:hypothetical protein
MQASLYGRSRSGKYALDLLYFPIKIVVVLFHPETLISETYLNINITFRNC